MYYICIDLKSFYASVEAVERGLDPLTTNLVVADPSRSSGSICLAITPALKKLGVKNRCRVYEIPKDIHYITAKPRMKLYIEYSARIYGIYLRYISKDDIHPYSVDEVFIDITNYLKLYKMTPKQLTLFLINKVFEETKITATAGIGTNLYLAKVALDITAKKTSEGVGFLDEETFRSTLGNHVPLKDFWGISYGIESHLNRLNIYTMNDIANYNEEILYKEFGINAEIIIDHAKGIEPVRISDIKSYRRKSNSISQSQVLFEDYSFEKARLILKEMVDIVSLDLVEKGLVSNHISLSIGYTKNMSKATGGSRKISVTTNLYKVLIPFFLELYDATTKRNIGIRTVAISFGNCMSEDFEQYDLFTDYEEIKKEKSIEVALNNIKRKYGKNAILKGMNYLDDATAIKRNKLIGGHNGYEDDE